MIAEFCAYVAERVV